MGHCDYTQAMFLATNIYLTTPMDLKALNFEHGFTYDTSTIRLRGFSRV